MEIFQVRICPLTPTSGQRSRVFSSDSGILWRSCFASELHFGDSLRFSMVAQSVTEPRYELRSPEDELRSPEDELRSPVVSCPCGGQECQRATSGNFGVSEISETPPGSRSSGFSDIRVLGAPTRPLPRTLKSWPNRSSKSSSSSSKKRPNIDKRQEYVATLQSFPRYCQHWKRFVVERCV